MDMRSFGMYEGFTHLASLVICVISQNRRIGCCRCVNYLMNPKIWKVGVTRTSVGYIVVRIPLAEMPYKLTEMTEKIP